MLCQAHVVQEDTSEVLTTSPRTLLRQMGEPQTILVQVNFWFEVVCYELIIYRMGILPGSFTFKNWSFQSQWWQFNAVYSDWCWQINPVKPPTLHDLTWTPSHGAFLYFLILYYMRCSGLEPEIFLSRILHFSNAWHRTQACYWCRKTRLGVGTVFISLYKNQSLHWTIFLRVLGYGL